MRRSRIDWALTLAEALNRGETARQLASRLGVAYSSVYRAARVHRLRLHRNPSAPQGIPWDAEFRIALRTGETASEMARRLRCAQKSVWHAARRRGVKLALGSPGRGARTEVPRPPGGYWREERVFGGGVAWVYGV